MRLHILSDLHLEFQPWDPPDVEADLTILAGDTHLGERGVRWAQTRLADRKVLYILGNHEFYQHAAPKLIDKLRDISAGSNVTVLENEAVVLDGVAFLGAVLWTDFELLGKPVAAELAAETGMNDYRMIRVSPSYRRLRPSDTRRLHAASVAWLRRECEKRRGEKLVIITHHAPSARSLTIMDNLSPCFASNLDSLIAESDAAIWVHGHTHLSADYFVGNTRVISNQRGYPHEDNRFAPDMVVEV